MQILSLNLAQRPFRNNTLLWAGYGLAFAALLLFTGWTASRFLETRGEVSRIVDTEVNFDTRMAQLKQRNDKVLAAVRAINRDFLWIQSEKANEVLAWKSFSWTRLFNTLEDVQPNDVRLTSIRPMFRAAAEGSAGQDSIISVPVAVEGTAKTYGDLARFQLALQEDPHFGRIEPLTARRTDNREYKYQMRFQYIPVLEEELEQPEDGADIAQEAGGDAAEPALVAEEIAPDDFADEVVEEGRDEPSATDNIQRRIERPRRDATEQKP